MENSGIEILLGKEFSKVYRENGLPLEWLSLRPHWWDHSPIYRGDFDNIVFEVSNEEVYIMAHLQDCCESVNIEDICGELDWLVGAPILVAEERTNQSGLGENDCESQTWTFYELATVKGAVTIRWYGTSNGYYSEAVSIMRFI